MSNFIDNFNNNKSICRKNQQLLKKYFLSAEFIANPESFFESMSKYELMAFNRLIEYSRKNGASFLIKNSVLAGMMGCSTATVSRWKKSWKDMGLISVDPVYEKTYGIRAKQSANYYTLSQYFSSREAESLLGHLLPALRLLTLSLLMVFGIGSQSEIIANEKYNKVIYIRKDIKNLLYSVKNHSVAERIVRRSGKMGLVFDEVVPIHVREIKELKLTRSGMIRLSGYPGSAIEHARRGITITKKFIDSPFGYFVTLCDNYCKLYDIKPDWKLVELMKRVFGYEEDDPMLLSNVVSKDGSRWLTPKGEPVSKSRSSRSSLKREVRKSRSSFKSPLLDSYEQGSFVGSSSLSREKRSVNTPFVGNYAEDGSQYSSGIASMVSNLTSKRSFAHHQSDSSYGDGKSSPGRNYSNCPVSRDELEFVGPAHKVYAEKPKLTEAGKAFLRSCGLEVPEE